MAASDVSGAPRRASPSALSTVIVQRTSSSMQSLLSTLPLFSGLAEKSIERLARSARQIHATKGTLLFNAGDMPEAIYTVVSGLVKLAVPTAAEQEKVVTLLGAGKSFGLSAVFADEPHVASAAAVQESVVAQVAKAQVIAVMKRDPLFASAVAANLSRRLRELLSEVRSSTAESGMQRTVTFLLRELPEAAADGAASITLPAKKRIIASRLALTGEHFSRILHELTSARLISVDGPKVTIPDVSRLRKYANGSSSRDAS